MNAIQLSRRWNHFKGNLKQIEGNYEKLLGHCSSTVCWGKGRTAAVGGHVA